MRGSSDPREDRDALRLMAGEDPVEEEGAAERALLPSEQALLLLLPGPSRGQGCLASGDAALA